MAQLDPLEELKAKYEFFVFRNKSHRPQRVVLADGNSVQVGERGTLKLRSERFHQLPEFSKFIFVNPTISDLREVGLLKDLPPKVAKTKPTKKTTAPASSSAEE